jgi:hypothetical protein
VRRLENENLRAQAGRPAECIAKEASGDGSSARVVEWLRNGRFVRRRRHLQPYGRCFKRPREFAFHSRASVPLEARVRCPPSARAGRWDQRGAARARRPQDRRRLPARAPLASTTDCSQECWARNHRSRRRCSARTAGIEDPPRYRSGSDTRVNSLDKDLEIGRDQLDTRLVVLGLTLECSCTLQRRVDAFIPALRQHSRRPNSRGVTNVEPCGRTWRACRLLPTQLVDGVASRLGDGHRLDRRGALCPMAIPSAHAVLRCDGHRRRGAVGSRSDGHHVGASRVTTRWAGGPRARARPHRGRRSCAFVWPHRARRRGRRDRHHAGRL